jgi:hypothetical protein
MSENMYICAYTILSLITSAAAYATRKVAMWTQLATVSEKQFQSVNTLYQAVLTCNS